MTKVRIHFVPRGARRKNPSSHITRPQSQGSHKPKPERPASISIEKGCRIVLDFQHDGKTEVTRFEFRLNEILKGHRAKKLRPKAEGDVYDFEGALVADLDLHDD